ncbi:MAG: quinol:cytochrome C oxidoreductase, partial [Chryseotalea sp.]
MGHHITVESEQYIFKAETKKKLFILIAAGLVLFAIGVFMAMTSDHGGHEGHAAISKTEMLANAEPAQVGHAEGEHHGSANWVKRIYTSLWMNNIYFVGLGIVGLFFVCIQYAAQAGWSSGLKRVPLAMGRWIPIAALLTIGLWFLVKGDLFHWTHHDVYEGANADKLLTKKSPYFFWPLHAGSFPLFYFVRMVLFFGLWYWFFLAIKKKMEAEDLDGSTTHWYKSRSLSAWFLVFFGVSSSVAAWDWVMSIDAHWFSTMFGWYVFASWWVSGLAFIVYVVVKLKEAGYLK